MYKPQTCLSLNLDLAIKNKTPQKWNKQVEVHLRLQMEERR